MSDFNQLFDLEETKNFIGIPENDNEFDEQIISLFPFYVNLISTLINKNLNNLTEEEQLLIKSIISVGTACHIMISNPRFGLKQQNWKVGHTAKTFARRYKIDFINWCDFYEDLLAMLNAVFSGDVGVARRQSVSNTYERPFP